MQISNMTYSDYEQIKDKLIDEFDDFWTPTILEKEIQNPNCKYIVAKDDLGSVLGFAGIVISAQDVEITNIVTKKSERGNGIGQALLEELINISKQTGLETISLEVSEINIPAQKLYEKLGFVKVGQRKRYYNGKYDALILTKNL